MQTQNHHDAAGFGRAEEVKALLTAARRAAPNSLSELDRLLESAIVLLPAEPPRQTETRLDSGQATWALGRLTISYPEASPHILPYSPFIARLDGTRSPSAAEEPIKFRRFFLAPSSRTLLRDGVPVVLGSRAFDLLYILLKFRGLVVSKTEIIQGVWPGLIVEESNLRFQMAGLRRALGPDRDLIKTICGRGYLLVA